MFLLPRLRRELASASASTKRRVPLREMAPPRSRRRDQPRASGERRSAGRDLPVFFFVPPHSLIGRTFTRGNIGSAAPAASRWPSRRLLSCCCACATNMQRWSSTLSGARRQVGTPAGPSLRVFVRARRRCCRRCRAKDRSEPPWHEQPYLRAVATKEARSCSPPPHPLDTRNSPRP